MKLDGPTTSQDLQAHGVRTTTGNGIAHVTPGCNALAAIAPELLTTKQAAKLCGIGERTLWRWSHSGRVPRPITIGDGARPAVRYRRGELLRWIEAGCPRVDGRAQG